LYKTVVATKPANWDEFRNDMRPGFDPPVVVLEKQ